MIAGITFGAISPSLLGSAATYICSDDDSVSVRLSHGVDSEGDDVTSSEVLCTGPEGTRDRTFGAGIVLVGLFFLPIFSLCLMIFHLLLRSETREAVREMHRLTKAGRPDKADKLKHNIGSDFMTFWFMGAISAVLLLGAWIYELQEEPTDPPPLEESQ